MKKVLGFALLSSACVSYAQLEPSQNFTFTNSVQNTSGQDVVTVYNNFGFANSLGFEVPTSSLTYATGIAMPDGTTDTVLNLNFMDFLKFDHGIAPNGGGLYVNTYSVVMDLKVPEENTWIPLFQTNTSNANDGDYWIRDSDSFWGVSSNYVGPALDRSRWNRIIAVVELRPSGEASTVTTYNNGTLIRTQTISTNGRDGRWSLDPQILILADNDGETPTTAQLANLAVFGRGLSGAEAQYLGQPSANTIVMSQTVSGTLDLSNTVSSFAVAVPVSFKFIQNGNVVYSGTVDIASSSTGISVQVPKFLNGDYTVEIDGGPFLKVSGPATLSGTGLNFGTITLVNGDVDGSGEVDAADIDLVIANFGQTFPGGTGEGNTDVDQSGEVDAADIDIVIANFGATDL